MGKISVYDKILIENPRKKENMEIKIFYIHLHLKDRLHMNSQLARSKLMTDRALTSFTLYV